MTRWTPRIVLPAALVALSSSGGSPAGTQTSPSSIVILTGQQASMPIPTLMEGAQSNTANSDIADQLFLRLAVPGPSLTTAGDHGFTPLLARSWTRRDSLTLAFEVDPRARWQDGAPVTSRDVVFTFGRARNPAVSPKLADLLRHIASVTAEDDHRVVIRFDQAYAEQLYDATYHVAPLPVHLLAALSAEEIRRAPFVEHPVGSGPYRWVRSVPGQFVELAANDQFFMGAPAIKRVIVRTAADQEARINLLLSGDADAMNYVSPPLTNLARVSSDRDLRLVPVPSPTVGYLLFNARDPADHTRPHPILSDREVRRAIILALDRRVLVRAVFGRYGEVPYGPASGILWIRHGAPKPLGFDRERARKMLGERGWMDHDGDGILDRAGRPLRLTLNLPNTSASRRELAQLVQEQLRQVGIGLELRQLEGPLWNERRNRGDFDLDFSAASQDPSPSGLVQSWSCDGGSNVGRYCDPGVDSLLERAVLGRGNPGDTWHEVLRRIEEDAPAVFLYAPTDVYAVRRRFGNVTIRPESSWLLLRDWTVGSPSSDRVAGY